VKASQEIMVEDSRVAMCLIGFGARPKRFERTKGGNGFRTVFSRRDKGIKAMFMARALRLIKEAKVLKKKGKKR